MRSPTVVPHQPPAQARRLPVIDVLRGITILWVTALHFYIDSRGVPGPDVASAGAAWDALRAGSLVEVGAVVLRSLVGLPGFRLDLLLFVTAFVAMRSRPVSASTFYARRFRAILPQYWLGTLAVLVVCLACAWLRAAVGPASFSTELHAGARLAGEVYRFEWLDLLRSLSLVGRLEDARAMQVVAPSLWYIVLVAQLIVVLPWLRRLHDTAGSAGFLALAAVITWGGRAWVFAAPPLAGFDANATVVCFLPFRLIAPALGIVTSRWMAGSLAGHPTMRVSRPMAATGSAVAVLLLVSATWLGIGMNEPGTLAGVLGPVPPLALALPGLWWLAGRSLDHPWAGGMLRWAGTHSLSILVVQDALRVTVGTAGALDVALAPWTFVLLPAYLGVALLLARAWHPWPEAAARVLTRQGGDQAGRACSTTGLDVVPSDGAPSTPGTEVAASAEGP